MGWQDKEFIKSKFVAGFNPFPKLPFINIIF